MKKFISIFLVAAMAAGCLAGCGQKKSNEQSDSTDDGKLKVVTTIFPEYDWVKEIAGDKASNMDPTMLLDNGVDLHSYQPTSDDILKISDCDLFVYVGGESDGWVDDALKNATNKDIQENFAVASLKNRKGIISGIRSWI
ncbi:MAG: metal ABC transporter substrate-binding protein [Dorea longicatena]